MHTPHANVGLRTSDLGHRKDDRSPSVRSPLSEVLSRLGLPLFLFGTSLFALLLISFTVILPHFTRFDLGGRALSASAVGDYRDQLRAQIKDAEEKRDDFLLPSHDAVYDQLRTRRTDAPDIVSIRKSIISIASAAAVQKDAIVFRVMRIDARKETVHMEGTVRNSGPRSMTVLAQVVEALHSAPFTAELSSPLFERKEEPAGVFHSPFSFDITLRSDATH
ncbi:hypothetical protein HZA45_00960 [Candidatus Peregrinibacteria bacterium]|nr:hypothetical protein [Candidatus Peregrinibacteria bacterium]